ncbi:hypothetical protein Z962_p0026 (plasmid) [Clostridium botulinum C/D str. BKT12695]|nr:hypothetical protein Z962_p0026 [Clostridium botulinum C/D str. BKT12695]
MKQVSREYVLPKIYVVQTVEEYWRQEKIICPREKHFRRLGKKETIEFMFWVKHGFIRIDKKHQIRDEIYIDKYSYCLE